MSIAKDKTRQHITIHKTAWEAISSLAELNKMTPSELIEGIVMSNIAQAYAQRAKEQKKGK